MIFYDECFLCLFSCRNINNGTDKLVIREHTGREQDPPGCTGLCHKTGLTIFYIPLSCEDLEKPVPVSGVSPDPGEMV